MEMNIFIFHVEHANMTAETELPPPFFITPTYIDYPLLLLPKKITPDLRTTEIFIPPPFKKGGGTMSK